MRKLAICLNKNQAYLSLVAEVANKLCSQKGFNASALGTELENGSSLFYTLSNVISRPSLQVSEECLGNCLECLAAACLNDPLNTQVFFDVPNAFDRVISIYISYPSPQIRLASCRIVASCNKHIILPNLKTQKKKPSDGA